MASESPDPSPLPPPTGTPLVAAVERLLAERVAHDPRGAFLSGDSGHAAHLSTADLLAMARTRAGGGDLALPRAAAEELRADLDPLHDGSYRSFVRGIDAIADEDAHARSTARAAQERTAALSAAAPPASPRTHGRKASF